MSDKKLSHINEQAQARMVDVSDKAETERIAVASARVVFSHELLSLLKENSLQKGDALATARIAGIQAAKKTAELIPLCHPLPLTQVVVDLSLANDPPGVDIIATTKTRYRTGVEMEALVAAAVAALTLYDMGKSVDHAITIEYVRLEQKSGGRSGSWNRKGV